MKYVQSSRLEACAYQRAKEGKAFCGDSFFITATDDYFLCVIADGLGSGEYAHESSQAVTSVVKSNLDEDVQTLMEFSNRVLLRKRGAATAILKVNFGRGTFEYSCVGNIKFYLYTPSGKMVYPMPVSGYLSGRPQKFHTQTFPYERKSSFLFHSDGFVNQHAKPLLKSHQPVSFLAKKLEEQQVNKTDDVTFVVGSLL